METSLKLLSKEQLITLLGDRERIIREKEEEAVYLKALVEKFRRLAFGQRRERFEGSSDQMPLPFEAPPEKQQEQAAEFEKKKEGLRRKRKTSHIGRRPLPDHLPVEEVELHPDGDLSEMVCIGKEVTEELDFVPARFFIKRYIRFKYAPKDRYSENGVRMAQLPARVIDRGIPSAALLAHILVGKYMDHLSLYRQIQQFKREKIPVAASSIEGWARRGLERLEPLYDCLLEDTKSMGYLQADETTIRVLENPGRKSCHLGYYWVYHSPLDGTVLFDYRPTRAAENVENMLSGFKGYLQTDGYPGYKKTGARKDVIHLACWAHARREFFEAMSNDEKTAQQALNYIGRLYQVEREARETGLDPEARKALRLEKSLPVINEMAEWMKERLSNVKPKEAIGKAVLYSINRWAELSNYLYDGRLEIDNNQIENAIRPVAVGRKNYLFAGSHASAQRAAMIYSFFAICKKHEVNPYEWLRHTLENIMQTNHKNVRDLYPQNFKKKA
ncbi:IS66 family transposase [Negadavirga shengliensis]|uniref:IS66 family transposase n=1 Tax=Negadavirga shengliensis TaxID=1389218 RepID=A0ABV9SZW7_9BACT